MLCNNTETIQKERSMIMILSKEDESKEHRKEKKSSQVVAGSRQQAADSMLEKEYTSKKVIHLFDSSVTEQ
jgi:hypothetical protein